MRKIEEKEKYGGVVKEIEERENVEELERMVESEMKEEGMKM